MREVCSPRILAAEIIRGKRSLAVKAKWVEMEEWEAIVDEMKRIWKVKEM